MKRLKTKIAVFAILVTLLLIINVQPAFAQASIILSPDSGPPGTSVTVTGSGFEPNKLGIVWFDSDGDSVADADEPSTVVTSSGVGAFTTSLVVPDVDAGDYQIRADVPAGGEVEASATFTVLTPSIIIAPTSGPVGTLVAVSGKDFKLGATVTIFFDIDDDGVVDAGETVGTATAGDTGAFSTTFTAPTLPGGAYDVRATDGVNTSPSGVIFTITPKIVLSPASGPAGATITVTGIGFAANTPYDIWYDTDGIANKVDAGDTKLADVTTGADGTFTKTVTIPIGAVDNPVMVIGDGLLGDPLASAPFDVIPPAITLDPDHGPTGSEVVVAGVGFKPNTAYDVYFDKSQDGDVDAPPTDVKLADVTTGADGTFTKTVTIPTVPGGAYDVMVILDGQTGTPVTFAVFTVEPAIYLTPDEGPVGTQVTVDGTGFAANTPYDVWFDSDGFTGEVDAGDTKLADVTTGADGTFTKTVTIPDVAVGSYLIMAITDGATGAPLASETFTVLGPEITLTPPSGPPGKSVSISGTNFLAGASGFVWFDIDADSVLDPAEPYGAVTVSAAGTFTTSLTVPDVAAGDYRIRADVPSGAPVEDSEIFTVSTPSIIISPISGPPGTLVAISGTNFKLGATVTIFFDINTNGLPDPGEIVGTATASAIDGSFSTTFTAPTLSGIAYNVRATDSINTSPLGVIFTITPAIALTPVGGPTGTTVSVAGRGFVAGATVEIWFDRPALNGLVDRAVDTQLGADVTVGADGTFSVSRTIPVDAALGPTAIMVIGDGGSGTPLASATFTVSVSGISVSPTTVESGTIITVSGWGFPPAAAGRVWFDINNDNVWDLGEPYALVIADAAGAFTTTLTTPDVPLGSYWIRADVPSGGLVEASAQVAVVAPGFATIFSAIQDIEDKLETLPDIPSLIDAAKSAILGAISDAQEAIIAAINSAKADILAAISGLDAKLDDIQADLSDIKAAIAPPIVIEDSKICPTRGSVELFDVDKTEMAGRFKVSFTIDATELDSGDRVYVEVYVKATTKSGLVLAKQVLVYGRTGADPREVYMDSLVNAEQVVVKLKWYYGTTSDDPIHFQAVISSP
jgi:hypothetical protein